LGSKIDVAVIPIEPLAENSAVLAVNDETVNFRNATVGAGTDAFILGYPHGISGGAHFPVWKRGSIASEPTANVDRLPKMLVDASTRRGMSGSPVFAHVEGMSFPEGADPVADFGEATFGSTFQFMGCYSGSIGREPFEAQLGIAWKEEAITHIIDSRHVGPRSEDLTVIEADTRLTHTFFDWDDWGDLPNPG
ncbi:hypothetical protein ACV22V_11595, partial [Burkholderia sp. AW33-5]